MEIKENQTANYEDLKKYTPKKGYFTESISINSNPNNLKEKPKPDDRLVELENGFTMYPAEILEFSEGADSEF